jgi:hypothetical protein
VQGAPDPYWRIDKSLVVVFEDHSDGTQDGTISISKARQAAGHERTIRKHLELETDATVITVLVTPAASAADEALQHLESVHYVSLDQYKGFTHNALEAVRSIRATMGGNANLEWRQQILDVLLRERIAPQSLIAFVTEKRASEALAGKEEQ